MADLIANNNEQCSFNAFKTNITSVYKRYSEDKNEGCRDALQKADKERCLYSLTKPVKEVAVYPVWSKRKL